jgi:hypothetical protein
VVGDGRGATMSRVRDRGKTKSIFTREGQSGAPPYLIFSCTGALNCRGNLNIGVFFSEEYFY